MGMDPMSLALSILFGAIGMGYAAYGRKNNFYFLLSGFTLMAVTFFTLDSATMWLIGIFLTILPFILTKFLD